MADTTDQELENIIIEILTREPTIALRDHYLTTPHGPRRTQEKTHHYENQVTRHPERQDWQTLFEGTIHEINEY